MQRIQGLWMRLQDVPRFYWGLLLLAMLGMAVAIPFEPWVQPDSPGYIAWASCRQPLYPWFLMLFQCALPEAWALHGAVAAQLALGLGAGLFCARRLQTLLKAPSWLGGVFLAVFLGPYFIFHQIGHAITSEAIAYPLFLMMVATFFTGVLRRDGRAFGWSLFWTTLLVLTRGQFLCLYAVWTLAVIGPSGLPKRGRLWLVAGILLSFLASQGIQRTALYLKDGHFANVPFTGSLALVIPLYISGESDGVVLPDAERQLFEAIRPGIQGARLLAANRPSDVHPLWHVETIYNTIQFGHIFPAFERLGLDPYAGDKIAITLAIRLSMQHLVQRVTLFIQMWVKRWEYSYTLMMGFLTASVLWLWVRQRAALAPLPRALFWGIVLECANMGAILSVEMPLMRYMLYTTVLMGCFWIFLVWYALQEKQKN